jgi:hypothetical protein
MAPAVPDSKDPAKVKAGALGARARWGPLRIIRLDELTTEQRRLVLALVSAGKPRSEDHPETIASLGGSGEDGPDVRPAS